MYLTNGLIFLPNKDLRESQILENVDKRDFDPNELTRALRDAINAENEAIKQYEVIIDSTDNSDVQKVLRDIADEERVHVGELQELLSMLLDDEDKLLEEGREEVREDILDSDDSDSPDD